MSSRLQIEYQNQSPARRPRLPIALRIEHAYGKPTPVAPPQGSRVGSPVPVQESRDEAQVREDDSKPPVEAPADLSSSSSATSVASDSTAASEPSDQLSSSSFATKAVFSVIPDFGRVVFYGEAVDGELVPTEESTSSKNSTLRTFPHCLSRRHTTF